MSKRIALLVLAACAAISLSGCGGSSSKPLSVSVTASSNTVDGSDTVTLSATVANDTNSAGVSWALTSGGGALSNQTTTSATYTAPAATSSQQSITITATSVAKSTDTGTVTLTVPAAPSITSLTAAQQAVAVGTAYSVTLGGAGGISPYKSWALANGSASLPSCLSLSSAGVLSSPSTPTAACVGVYSGIKFTMTDSGTPNALSATSSAQTITVTGPTVAFSPTLPAGNVGVAYAGSVAATGVIGASTYSLAGGALPADLSLNANTGAITGTPNASDAGTFSFSVKVVDAFGDTATSGNLSIVISAPNVTFSPTLPAGNVGVAYAGSVAATGVVGASTYTLASGALPADLSLNASTGAITGTPKASDVGTFTIAVKVVDAFGDTATSGNLSINITAPTITFPASLPGDTVGTAYSGSVAASGPVGASTYTIASGALPADLSLNSSTGAIVGTPKASDVGTFTITVNVVDAYGDTATSGNLGITITAPTITFPASLPGDTVGTAYSGSVAATGVVGASTYTIAGGSLGSDLSLNSSTGAITGTPKAADVGTLTLTVKVVDAYGDTATSGSLSIIINPAGAITFGAAPTATATAGVAYSSALTATGGAGALTYSITTGALPTGLNLIGATGAITGTPTTVGPATFTAEAQDSFGDTPATQSYTITVNPGAATHFAVALTSSSTITAGSAVSFTVTALDAGGNTATGYSGTVAFASTDTAATLPTASALASGVGSFSATLKTAGNQTVTATDTGNATIAGTTGTITVNPGGAASLTVTGPANATTNVAFNFSVTAKDSYGNTATGFADTVNFSSTDGSAVLPSPSTLNTGTGTFSVTMNTTGAQTITATDAANGSIKGTSPAIAVANTVTITTASIGPFNLGQSVSQTLDGSGGSGNSADYNWSWTAGSGSSIPPGLSISTAGVISGTPTASGNYTVSVTVKDTGVSPNQTFTQNFTIVVNSALTLPTPNPASLPGGYIGVSYSGSLAASGGSGNYCYSVISGLPSDGLTKPANNSLCGFVASSFPVSGTPTAAATVTFTLKVTDTTTSESVSQTYTISVTTPTAPSLPTPSSSIPGSGTNGQAYSETINATGGVGPTYTWTINGTTVSGSLALGTSGLSSQFSVSNSGSSTLSISGSPTSIGSFTFTAQVKDNTTNLTSSTQTYTIQVNSAGQNVSGQISFNNVNSCNGVTINLPTFSVTLKDSGGNTVQTTSTDSNGNFSFTSVPNGTYSIAPSYSGPSGSEATFYPVVAGANAVTVNNADVTGRDFAVSLGYVVQGTAHYSGTVTQGWVYLELVNNCGGSGSLGTAIAYPFTSSGAYTIRGVPPGSYKLLGIIDPIAPIDLDEGYPNSADPLGTENGVTVSNATVNQDVFITDPTGITVGNGPTIKSVSPQGSGAVLQFGGVGIGSGTENYYSYTVQWSTSTSGFSTSNQATFKATGASGSNVWIIDAADKNFAGSLTNGTSYYFRASGTNSAGTSPWNYWSGSGTSCTTTSCAQTMTIGAPSEPYTVSGAITIPAGVTINSGAVLYAGLYDQNTQTIYAYVNTSPASGANNFTVNVPSGSNYQLFGILDQNHDGLIDAGDDSNVNGSGNLPPVVVSGNLTGQNATLPSGNTIAAVQTQFQSYTNSGGTSTNYALNLKVAPGNKLPVDVTLTGGPNVFYPVDLGSYCQGCGNIQFQDYFNIAGAQPTVGDTYTFTVVYNDGSSDTNVTAQVTGWDGGTNVVGVSGAGLPTNLAPGGATSTNLTPNFTWTFPTNPSDFTYQFQLQQQQTNQNITIWQIPGNNSNSNGFTYTQTSGGSGTTGTIAWGVDPTGDSSNTPSVTTLPGASTYYWSISASDSNGNEVQTSTYFTTP